MSPASKRATSPRSAAGFLIHAAEIDGERVGQRRNLTMPGLSITVGEMVEALKRVAAQDLPDLKLGDITVEPDPFIEKIVATWPLDASHERATALGLPRDPDLDTIVRAYIEDYVTVAP